MRRLGLMLLAFVPALLLLALAEGIARIAADAQPSLITLPLPGEGNLFRPDRALSWSLRPSHRTTHGGVEIVTNRHGLRSPPIGPKRPRELRILSLGESTTFGSRIPAASSYTALLGKRLQRAENAGGGQRRIVAINAGVPAYSSFQSLVYLEKRGLALEPDVVLVYHEANDYLPSSVRDSSNTEIGVLKTDKELYAARRSWLHRLAAESVLVRVLQLRLAQQAINDFDGKTFDDPFAEIGMPEIGLRAVPSRLRKRDGDRDRPADLPEAALGRRVSEAERAEILADFARIAEENEFALVVIHPSYKNSVPHECVLTRFARDNPLLWLDVHEALHPADAPPGSLFLDAWHPSAEGHSRLADALAAFLREHTIAGE